MAQPTDSQQFLVYDPNYPPQRSRQPSGLLGSIWAPQPQPSGTTWPSTLETFSREAEQYARFDTKNPPQQMSVITREDVFGPGDGRGALKASRDIGAIGDGRKKNSPDYENSVRF